MSSIETFDPEIAIELCNEILDKLDELPEAAEEFSDSIKNKVLDIHEWVDSRNHCTKAQMGALENMLAGVERWIR